MKKVKVLKNDGNTVYVETESDSINPPAPSGDGIAWVTYGQTPRSEILDNIRNQRFMICKYHVEGYNTAFVYPLAAVINFSHPGTEIVEFTNNWIDGSMQHITYNAETDTWSQESKPIVGIL